MLNKYTVFFRRLHISPKLEKRKYMTNKEIKLCQRGSTIQIVGIYIDMKQNQKLPKQHFSILINLI